MTTSLIRDVYQKASVVDSGRFFTTVNELTDQLPALRPQVLRQVTQAIRGVGDFNCDKILVEEEKGAIIGAAISLETGLPLAMARPYTYQVPGIRVNYDSEYCKGSLFVNGIVPGDRVTIVDDTISTGGVLVALIRAVREAGAIVHDVIAVIEKVDNGGVARVQKATGIEVKTILKIQICDGIVQVL